jgi:hypothetical protein
MRVSVDPTRSHTRQHIVTLGAVVTAVVLAAGQTIRASATGNPTRPVSRDLDTYVLFAFDTLHFKGGQNDGRGIITGGDVGANGVDTAPEDSSPILNICANNPVTMDPGSQVNADTLRINTPCTIWDVYANTVVAGSDAVPQNSGPNSFTTQLLSTLPTIPAFDCNPANPLTVAKGGSSSPVAGTYGNVVFQDDATVTLGNGIYNLCDLHIGKHATINTSPATEIRITHTFSINNDAVFGPECTIPIFVRADGHTSDNDVAISMGKHTTVAGKFLTLLGNINLGDDTNLVGQFVGRTVNSDKNVNVTGCRPNNAPTTTSTTTMSSSSSSTSSTSSTTSSSLTSSTSTTTTTFIFGTSTIQPPTTGSPPITHGTPSAPQETPPGELPSTGSGSGLFEFAFFAVLLGGALGAWFRGRTKRPGKA